MHQLRAGRNFTDFKDAQPGDFMKIWWNDYIGSKERGHSVIYLGGGKNDDVGPDQIKFWSSNIPDGYGTKTIPITNAKRVLFTRLDAPQAFANAAALPRHDAFLASMLKRTVTQREMFEELGMVAASVEAVVVPQPVPVEDTPPAPTGAAIVARAVPISEKIKPSTARQIIFQASPYAKADNVTQIKLLRQIQSALAEKGFYKGKPDGATGPATHEALLAFQTSIKEQPTGLLDETTLLALGVQLP
jgi:hypothetical protein